MVFCRFFSLWGISVNKITWAPWPLGHCWDSGAPGGPIDEPIVLRLLDETLQNGVVEPWIWRYLAFGFGDFIIFLGHFDYCCWQFPALQRSAWRMKKIWRLEKALCTFNAAVRMTTQSRTFPSTSSQKWLYLKPSKVGVKFQPARGVFGDEKSHPWKIEVSIISYNFWFRLRSEIRQVSFEQSSKPIWQPHYTDGVSYHGNPYDPYI